MAEEKGKNTLRRLSWFRIVLDEVEPQWNPSVEEQAIARALRMGQTREVIVLRYVVQRTVEQNITHLQKKKSSVAKFMFNVGAAEELDGKLEDLKFVLDLDSSPIG
ncbi:Helicase-like transcription factor [Colletotrichum tropicale]|nr:Helicase-like transcription factor [Colletotrichum tropicale]